MKTLTLHGRVERGEGMATELGCPTANIAIEQGVLIPALGVYVGMAKVDGARYPSLICVNDGRTGHNLKMEVHLLGECVDLEGKRMSVSLLEKLRGLVPFENTENMKALIQEDIKKANAWFEARRDNDSLQQANA